ncbi:3-dehydroquinate synthase [uncultured Kriegella sp.]|uniref:3-dehydroquinate synthase n=1 Tax=uncultured Kriegella sp. TaxID=1798910 RepID=UPI0030D95D70|tara:strand:+ start:140440 stop:141606 length:1167 start_codon:yes stop_codon:yes gene_type:complete
MNKNPISQSFAVKYEYKLYFTDNLFSLENALFKTVVEQFKNNGPVKLLFVIDEGVHNNHPDLIQEMESYCGAFPDSLQYTENLVVPGGERSKNDHMHVERILKAINSERICRHSFVVAIGGGAVVDMVGYAAAIAHRGVKLIRIPTTVLSQNDAAVGVKNSINIFGKKNFLGTFAPPQAIINDGNFLKTLQHRDWIAGIAEGIKVALIKDAQFFDYIAQNAKKLAGRDDESMHYLIYRCAEMHMHHIANGGDPFESGSSRPLDFGHWAAHKLEHMTHYRLRHGEAVAIGMALDLTYSKNIGLIDEKTLTSILEVMDSVGFDLTIPLDNDREREELLRGIQEFREHLGGELTITLISEIGKKVDVHEIDMTKMRSAIFEMNERAKLKLV